MIATTTPKGYHRHPNGGALVVDTASVAPGARVTGNARVDGDAVIDGGASVYGGARVYGSARIGGNAQIYGDAWIGGNARIGGDARIGGNAGVLTSRHHLTHGPVGSEDRTVTLYRTVGGGHRIVAGCWDGTCDELAARIAKSKQAWPDADKADRKRWKADYEAMLVAFRVRANEWEVES